MSGMPTPQLSVRDMALLANKPGPMQGMALNYLQQMKDSADSDTRSTLIGARQSPPRGLNYDPSQGATYPDELMKALVQRYGMQGVPPTGEGQPQGAGQSSVEPADQAKAQWMQEMQRRFPQPSWLDKAMSIGKGIISHPMDLARGAAGMAESMTPIMGNEMGWQDLKQHSSEAYNDDTMSMPEKLLNYGPQLVMDGMQMLMPISYTHAMPSITRGLAEAGGAYATSRALRPMVGKAKDFFQAGSF